MFTVKNLPPLSVACGEKHDNLNRPYQYTIYAPAGDLNIRFKSQYGDYGSSVARGADRSVSWRAAREF